MKFLSVGRKIILVVVIVLLMERGAKAVDESQIFLIGGTATDFISTVTTKGREANPLMGQNWKAQAGMMAGSTALTLMLNGTLKDMGHPKAAKILNYIVGGIHFGAAGWNFRLGLK